MICVSICRYIVMTYCIWGADPNVIYIETRTVIDKRTILSEAIPQDSKFIAYLKKICQTVVRVIKKKLGG